MESGQEQTIFSLADSVPAPLHGEGDGAHENAVLATGAVGELCSVRKLSRRGAVLHLDTRVEIGQFLSFELMNGRNISGTVSFVSGSEVILRFKEDLDVLGVIASELVSQPGERRRMPRVEMKCAATLRAGARVIPSSTVDVSQGGVRIELHERLTVGRQVILTMADFRPLESEIRWVEGGFAGLNFLEELSWQEMMPWLRGLSRRFAEASKPVAASLPRSAPPSAPAAEAAPTVALNIPARIREGAEKWSVTVVGISTAHVEFESYTRPRAGALISLMLPGLEGWPARVAGVDGDRWTCEFAHPLHPAVLARVLAARGR